jgi:hypothetical protein
MTAPAPPHPGCGPCACGCGRPAGRPRGLARACYERCWDPSLSVSPASFGDQVQDRRELLSWGLTRAQAAQRQGISARTAERYDAAIAAIKAAEDAGAAGAAAAA